ncbi:GDP-mannose 4,6-dehydratase [Hydrogenophaga sp. T4]|nr:GDP-mannose 4,6-dehydratase [Hydrogenophaga sp. T4]
MSQATPGNTSKQPKVAHIQGATVRDGSNIAEVPLEKGYELHGKKPYWVRSACSRLSASSAWRMSHGPTRPALTNSIGRCRKWSKKETTPFYPRGHYAVAKLNAYWIVVNYRVANGMYACSGLLFNHESPRRGETFVTRKITRGLANIAEGLESCLNMGNLDSLRDWGHAKDYVRIQWVMLQQDEPEDFVIATGVQYSVRQFIDMATKELGVTLTFEGTGIYEKADVQTVDGDKTPAAKAGDVIVQVDPRYFRHAGVETLLGEPAKTENNLGWAPKIALQEMGTEMFACDLDEAQRHAILKTHRYDISIDLEI